MWGLSSVFACMFGESVVSFPHAKRYNWLCITEATSFGKDKGSVNRRGAEPFVFIGAFFILPIMPFGRPFIAGRFSCAVVFKSLPVITSVAEGFGFYRILSNSREDADSQRRKGPSGPSIAVYSALYPYAMTYYYQYMQYNEYYEKTTCC